MTTSTQTAAEPLQFLAADGTLDPSYEPSFSDALPNGGPSLPAPEDLESQAPNPNPGTATNPSQPSQPGTTGNNANVTAPTDGSCADQEVSLTPLPASATVKRGAPLVITAGVPFGTPGATNLLRIAWVR